MTQELLIKDLSARLPYGVKCYGFQMKIDGNDNECYGVLKSISDYPYGWRFKLKDRVALNNKKCYEENYSKVKPYLFPMSSMTEEQKREYFELLQIGPATGIDWLNKNHFDYRGLIPMGLAIDASGLNIY